MHPPAVVPVRTMQKAEVAGDLPPMDVDAVNVFSQSERILQDHVRKHNVSATELRDLIQMVLHHPDFNVDEVDHDMYDCLMRAIEDGDIEVLDRGKEGNGLEDNPFVKRKAPKVLIELISEECMAGVSILASSSAKMLRGTGYCTVMPNSLPMDLCALSWPHCGT
jgi:hypothetical protein